MVESIEFYDELSDTPIVNIDGYFVDWLVNNSQLIQMVLDSNPGEKHIVVYVNFPTDRIQTFRKIIQGFPIGNYTEEGVVIDPLGPQEERNIQTIAETEDEIQAERKRVIDEILDYLLIDPAVNHSLLIFRPYDENGNNNRKEMKRRQNITRKRENKRNFQPYLNEDLIENSVEQHKNYLFNRYSTRHGNRNRNSNKKLATLMPNANIQKRIRSMETKRNRYIKELRSLEENYTSIEKEIARLEQLSKKETSARNRKNIDEHIDYLIDKRDKIYNNMQNYSSSNNRNNFNNMHPINNSTQNFTTMSDVAFERYMRSKRKEGEEKHIPYQREYHLENLFGKSNNF